MRSGVLAFVVGSFAAGCGGESIRLGSADPTPAPSARGSGWSIRDDVPYPRGAHSAVLDENNDRMIVFGGGANDVWALPLSGPDANVWSQVLARGEHPPAHAYGSTYYSDSAVYDRMGKRLLVLLNPKPASSGEQSNVDLWQLSLGETAEWKRVVTWGPSPGLELQSGKLAIDVEGQRLFAVGGTYERSGVWTLPFGQGATPSWKRIAGTTPEPGAFYDEASLIFDAARQRLVFFSGHSRLGRIWALPLATSSWELLDQGSSASESYGATAVLDPDGDRIVFFGGDVSSGITSYSFSGGTWQSASIPPPYDAAYVGRSGVLDAARGRILYFGGGPEYPSPSRLPDNAVSALALDSLSWSELVPATRHTPMGMTARTLVWDPVRAAVVAYGDARGAQTDLHGLEPSDGWTPVTDVGWTTPSVSNSGGVYDPLGSAIFSFGGSEKNTLARLVWAPGPIWELLDAGPGPIGRSSHVAVYDSVGHRLVVHGGRRRAVYPPTERFDDVWTLPLGGRSRWIRLVPSGTSPGKRSDHVGIYDPKDRRLVIYAQAQSSPTDGPSRQGSWSLSLDDAPRWTELAVTGRSPGDLDEEAAAVYDPEGHRMVVVTFAKDGAARVFALELDSLAWHEFCWSTITPAKTALERSTGNAVLAPDGIFMTVSGGAFRFDLETSYCE
jgi:hypothetical protein